MNFALFATLIVGAPDWMAVAVAFIIIGAVVLLLSYRAQGSHSARPALGWLAASCKLLGIVALALCLVEPLWSSVRPRPGTNLFLLLVDNSRSLELRESNSGPTPAVRIRDAVADREQPWNVRLEQDFVVRRHLASADLPRVDNFDQLDFTSEDSPHQIALDQIKERYQGRPVAGVLFFTDGNGTNQPKTGTNAAEVLPYDATGLPPLYPVLFKPKQPLRDLAIEHISVTQTAFEDAPINIAADVIGEGYQAQPIAAQLLDDAGEILQQQVQEFSTTDRLVFRFQLRPAKPGLQFYRIRIAAESELKQFESGAISREATLVNNVRQFEVDRREKPYRVLYVSGRPNWEFKFLKRAVESDSRIELVGLIRIAKRQPKFDWRGKGSDASNELFKGFDRNDDDTERFDQPVIVRINTRDENELRDGFPTTAADLFTFDALILDDVEAEFFTQAQQRLLERFVTERGGGLLMLGGQESFHHGNYARTLVGEMLPVYLDNAASTPSNVPPASGYRMTLTRDGWLQPWMRLRNHEQAEQERRDATPQFHSVNPVRHIKPGATLLATVTDDAGTAHPAFAVQRFGAGRVGAILIADLWRWGLAHPEEERDLDRSWRQSVRWLVTDVPEPLQLQITQLPGSPSVTRLTVQARDAEFLPRENARIQLTVIPPDGPAIDLPAEPSLEAVGVSVATFVPRTPGGYRVEATLIDETGKEPQKVVGGWVHQPEVREFQCQLDTHWYEKAAEVTGGEVISADDLDAFVRDLAQRPLPVTEAWTQPLWHSPWMFAFAIICLVGEWSLRRWKGLP